MNKMISSLKKATGKKSLPVQIGAVFFACLAVVAVLLLFMPKGYADGDSIATAQPISNEKEYLSTGNYYRISRIPTNGMTLEIDKGISPDVYIVLDNVNFAVTTDKPAITITMSEDKKHNVTTDTRYNPIYFEQTEIKVHFILEGDSTIYSMIAGSKAPLIQAENYRFVTEKFSTAGNEAYHQGYLTYHSQNISLIIEENPDNNKRDSLTLKTATGSYGAAIGGGEAQQAVDNAGINTAIDQQINNNKDTVLSLMPDVPNDYFCYKDGSWLVDIPDEAEDIRYGASPVTIESGVVNIEGNGYGAGIGNGGSDRNEVSICDGMELIDMYGRKLNVSAGQNDSGIVTIRNGTVSVVMNGNGSCFTNSSFGGAVAKDGEVIIDGGSVYVNRRGDDMDTPYEGAINSDGDKLYLYKANYQKDIDGSKGDISSNFPLENVFDTEEPYEDGYQVEKIKCANGQESYQNGQTIEYLKTAVKFGIGSSYSFDGYYHESGYRDEEGELYFYLPAKRLPMYKLTIQNSSRFQYSTAELNKWEISNTELASLKEQTYKAYEGSVTIKETKYIIIKVENVPAYCTGVTASYVQTGGTVTTSGNLTVVKSDDDTTYYAYIGQETGGDITVTFTYAMGNFSITYDYGLLPEDKAEEGKINNGRNPVSAECGTTVSLSDPVWADHNFEGWYADSRFSDKIESVTSETLNEVKTVYAKWSCDITYKTEAGKFRKTTPVVYNVIYGDGGKFDILNPNGEGLPEIIDVNSNFYTLKGWEADGQLYTEESGSAWVTVHKNMTVTAKFDRTGYYVYITATFGDSPDRVDIYNYVNKMDMVYTSIMEAGFNEIDENNYYRTIGFVDNKEEPATLTLVPKAGYKVMGVTATDENGAPVRLISGGDSGLNQFDFTMPDCDVYITIGFGEEEYNITYYDVSQESGLFTKIPAEPNPESYTISDDLTFVRPVGIRGKYWKFIGFNIFGTESIITEIQHGTRTGDLQLIAQWEEIPVYDILIDDGEYGDIKAYVDGTETNVAAEGEEVTLVATAGIGIRLTEILYSWQDANGQIISVRKSYDMTNNTVELTFTMPASTVEVIGNFEVIEYTITYLNLNGARNDNPSTYTIFDAFTLKDPVKNGAVFEGWKIITPNALTEDPNDVMMTDIERIRDRWGNLMLYASWEDDGETNVGGTADIYYYITLDEAIKNGEVELTKTRAEENEYIFVKVAEKEGYRLKALSYSPTERTAASTPQFARLYLAVNTISVDISANQLTEGLYWFVMPGSDVEVTAVFEPIKYNITFNADGGVHDNKSEYTIEDDIVLKDAEKDGYIFKGWYDENGNKVDGLHSSMGDIILTAEYERIPLDSGNGGVSDNNGSGNDGTGDDGTGDNEAGNGNDSHDSGDTVFPPADVEKRPNTFVESGNIQTGDKADVTRLIAVCVISSVLLFILIPIKRRDEEEETSC